MFVVGAIGLLVGCQLRQAAPTVASPRDVTSTLSADVFQPTPPPETAVSKPTPTTELTNSTESADSQIAPTRRPVRLKPGDLQIAASSDDIPAIFADDDIFVNSTDGDAEWLDEELVIGIEVNGDARAYPIRLLSLHEIVNDTIGGQPVAVTWCPLCFSAIVFDRVIGEREYTFGVSGMLYNNNLVMYDHQSNTLWSQLLGQGIRGGQRGETLRLFSSLMTSWAGWKAAYPETRVLSAERLGNRADEIIDPYGGYYNSGAAGITGSKQQDDRLAAKTLVVGVTYGKEARVYPLKTVNEQKVINDELGTFSYVVILDEALETAVTYKRTVDAQTLTFSATEPGLLQDVETESVWDVRTGTAVAGSLIGAQLQRVAAPLVYWFAWSDQHIGSEIYIR